MSNQETILQLKNITKVYPGVKALDNVTLSFKKGEVHALLGENGAGKSTFIKIITGAIEPTSGSMIYKNEEYKHKEPNETLKDGIAAIYQEFNLMPYLSISENIFYGNEPKNGLFLDRNKMNQEAKKLLKEFDVDIDPKTQVKELGVAYQQIIEIVKAVSHNVDILIMDEPTAPLTNNETDAMFKVMEKLKANGVTIIYISHRLEELFKVCDRVSVMRDGQYIKTVDINDVTEKEMIALMVGRELGQNYPVAKIEKDEVILEVENLNNQYIHNIEFKLKKGEILGFGGLVGAGRTETARAIFGADPVSSGRIALNGKEINSTSPGKAIENGIGLIPEDRKQHGVLLGLSIKNNITYSSLGSYAPMGFINFKKEEQSANKLKDDLKIKTPSIEQQVKNLSGGNQQKVVLAKWMATNCEVIIFDEPTRGIDVGAKQEIYKLMTEMAERGKGIIMISSDMPELLGMADRIIVMHEGRISGELGKSQFSQEKVLELASGKGEE